MASHFIESSSKTQNPFVNSKLTAQARPLQRAKGTENTDEEEKNKARITNYSNVADLGKNISAEMEELSKSDDKFDIKLAKNGFGFLTEFCKKIQSGASFTESVGFALLKLGIDHATGIDNFKKIIGGKSPNGKLGILVTSLKAFGYQKAADILDVASKMSRQGLVGQGIVEGFTGFYDLIYNIRDEKKLEEMRQNQIKGDYGPITQGYSLLAALISSLALGDAREMEVIVQKAGRGELGTLPQIGDRLGLVAYEAQARVSETLKNQKTDDHLRTRQKVDFEKLSAYEKSEAIHHLITGYTSKADLEAILKSWARSKIKPTGI
ncbi:MAG: hypothetical protein HC913_23710 [Microscillaceae bacterium]|nr:hypothetical protein [Microscillaceae bacterium]